MPIPAGTLATLRADFGGTIADWVASSAGGAIRFGSAALTFWDAPTGGSQHTDLLLGNDSVDSIHVGIDGKIPIFQGPPGVTSMWVDAGQDRVLMNSANYASDYAAAAGGSAAQAQVAAAAAVAVGSTNDTIIAGRIAAPGSATQEAGDVRWAVRGSIAASGVNVKDPTFGAVGDGTTDDTAAFQAAITAAAATVGGRVYVPQGRYKIAANLSIPIWMVLEGEGQQTGSGTTAPCELLFTTLALSSTALTLGSLAQVRNLNIRGGGYSIAGVTGIAGSAMILDHVSVLEFAIGVAPTNGYYCEFTHVEWLRNGIGLKMSGCYNVTLQNACRFDCTNGATFGVAIDTGAVRGMSIYGCSIENYSVAVLLGSSSLVNFYGTYFETNYSGAVGVDGDGLDDITINALGCLVYIDNHNQWIKIDTSTNTVLNGHGQHFHCATGSATSPTAYYFSAGQDVDLSGDQWKEVVKTGTSYAAGPGSAVLGARVRIAWPVGSSTSFGAANNPVLTDGRVRVSPINEQTLAANGAVAFSAGTENQRVILAANATSSTIADGVNDQVIEIAWQQDSTGGRTYSWPATCKFAGNSAPSDTTASTLTTVRFRFRSSVGRWREIGRTVAVPVS